MRITIKVLETHTHTHTYIYICVCVCVFWGGVGVQPNILCTVFREIISSLMEFSISFSLN